MPPIAPLRPHQTGYFPSHDGVELFYQHWWHDDRPARSVLVMVHGLGGHSGLFENVVEALAPMGCHLYALDWRGNGRSPGRRGYINCWEELRGDIGAFLDMIHASQPHLPKFILGHSVGGAVVLDYVLHHPAGLQGTIISNPTLGAVGISPLRFAIARLLSQLWPTFSLSTGVDGNTGARDPALCAAYAADPLRHATGSARLATEYMATADWIQSHATDLQVPLLMLQGGADRVSLPAGSRRFFDQVTFPDKTWKEYPESYHEIYDDLDRQIVLADLSHWLQTHVPTV
jgi:alpha-beta hydrolase superfamily lysophospholipase